MQAIHKAPRGAVRTVVTEGRGSGKAGGSVGGSGAEGERAWCSLWGKGARASRPGAGAAGHYTRMDKWIGRIAGRKLLSFLPTPARLPSLGGPRRCRIRIDNGRAAGLGPAVDSGSRPRR